MRSHRFAKQFSVHAESVDWEAAFTQVSAQRKRANLGHPLVHRFLGDNR